MKTAFISPLMGTIQIPDRFNIVRKGTTRPKDQVAKDANIRFFTPVAAGGIPISRYFAVIRPMKGAKKVWAKTRLVDRPKPERVNKKRAK